MRTLLQKLVRLSHVGPNIMLGYYKDEKMTKETFTEDGWFKTGDLGLIVRGRLSLKGRSKTMILGPEWRKYLPGDYRNTYQQSPICTRVPCYVR